MREISLPSSTPKIKFKTQEGYDITLLWSSVYDVYNLWIVGYVNGRALLPDVDILEGRGLPHSITLKGDGDLTLSNASSFKLVIDEVL
jgi:hypothetical protein